MEDVGAPRETGAVFPFVGTWKKTIALASERLQTSNPMEEDALRTALLAVGVVLIVASAGPANQVTARVEPIAGGLEVPWSIAFAPDGRIFITERPGRIRIVDKDGLDARPYSTIDNVDDEGEGGLMGLALHPQFPRRPWLYVYYTYNPSPERSGRTYNRLVRITYRERAPWPWTVLLDRIPSFVYHDGGRVKFGPDGKLYVGTGYGEWPITSQRMDSLGGKILRLNDDGSIPQDNPFPRSPIYSYGHRNVQGLAWHPRTGRLYATEHGPTGEGGLCCRDEVNLIEAGKNYGWPHVAGVAGDPRFVDPVLSSGSVEHWAPSGATFASRGPWTGSLLIATLRGRHLRRVVFDETGRSVVRQDVLLPWQYGRMRDAVEGPDGAIYVTTSNRDGRGIFGAEDDRVLRIVP
jgi:aldose sugar dehydrogenase